MYSGIASSRPCCWTSLSAFFGPIPLMPSFPFSLCPSHESILSGYAGVIMRIVVPRETAPGEQRVALVPESCKKLIRSGYEIDVEDGAGTAAGFSERAYL